MSLDCYSRKLPLKAVTEDSQLLARIEKLVVSTNHVVRDTYQFIRLYFLHLLEQKRELPKINKPFLYIVFNAISIRQTGSRPTTKIDSSIVDDVNAFYHNHYEKIQTVLVNAPNKNLLDYEATKIITCINNHIKTSFFTYVNRLVYALCPNDKENHDQNEINKKERKKLRNDMFEGTFTAREELHPLLVLFSQDIRDAKFKW